MKKTLYVICLAILLASCTDGVKGKYEHIKWPKVTLKNYDTLIVNNVNDIQKAQPVVIAVNVKNSIALNNETFLKDAFEDHEASKSPTDSLIVFVDSKLNFHYPLQGVGILPPPPPSLNKGEFQKRARKLIDSINNTHYEMYPVFIFNSGNRDRVVAAPIINGGLYAILEAKTKTGLWQPIEYWKQFGFLCGTGHLDYKLKSNHFIVAGVRKYIGNYKTLLRLKLRSFDKVYYSNTFDGTINESQFNTDSIIKRTKKLMKFKREDVQDLKINGLFLN